MPEFCDVALPVPLEANFTYRLDGVMPVIGGRVIVPFREQRLPGIVVALHDNPPRMAAKNVLTVLDASPVLDPELMKLGQWIADYYVAPLGEVFRTMLPLGAVAAKNLLQMNASMGEMRSRSYDFRGAKLFVTYHPAYLLRDPRQKSEAWKDLQQAMKYLGLKVPAKGSN